MTNNDPNEKQKLEALLKKAAASQDFVPPDDALSKLIEEYSVNAKTSGNHPPAGQEEKHSLNFKEFLAFLKERENRKSS